MGEALGQALASFKAGSVSGTESQHDAMVMVEDPADLVIVGEIQDVELASELNIFVNQMEGKGGDWKCG